MPHRNHSPLPTMAPRRVGESTPDRRDRRDRHGALAAHDVHEAHEAHDAHGVHEAQGAHGLSGGASRSAPVRLVFVGAGPAAVMLLERLLASHRRDCPELRLEVQLIDPHEPGGGRIWRRDQSPLLKLNSMLEDVAFFTDLSCEIEGPIETGPSLAEWVRRVRTGDIALPAWSDEALETEIAEIGDRDFPTRRLNNAYLGWAYREVQRRAEPTVDISWLRGRAVAVETGQMGSPADPAKAGVERHTVRLESGLSIPADLVVYALGHNGSRPSADSIKLGAFAERHRLRYVAPAFTADLDLQWVAAGESVIVRGMGLAAVDLTVLLTEGRGGRFERGESGRLRYLPSGREPLLHLGSRRGVPYRSKITSTLAGAPVQLEYLGPEFHDGLRGRGDALDFERDVWPLVCADLLTGYYRELFTGHPDRVTGSWELFSARLREVLAEPGGFASAELSSLICAHVADPDDRFELASFTHPLGFAPASPSESAERGADDDEAVQRRVLAHIEQDLRQRTRQEHSATQALFLTALFAYMSTAEIPVDTWNAVSRAVSLPRRWHSFFSYIASGPPGHRLEELIALAEAGIVRFVGGDIDLSLDECAGRFVIAGSAETASGIARTSVSAETLIDAWLPEAQAERSDNPLLRYLIESGQAHELTVSDAEFAGSTGQVVVGAGGALDGHLSGGRAVDGRARQFALGPFTSAPSAGAFTRPGINSLPFRVHDRCARALLAGAQEVAQEMAGAGRSSPNSKRTLSSWVRETAAGSPRATENTARRGAGVAPQCERI